MTDADTKQKANEAMKNAVIDLEKRWYLLVESAEVIGRLVTETRRCEMKKFMCAALIGLLVVGCATTKAPKQASANPKESIGAADVIGTIVNAPLALATHIVWSVWGILTYPIAALKGDEDSVTIYWSGQVGPTYSSSKFLKHWAYYGNEPSPVFLKTGERLPPHQPVGRVEIDLSFAPFQDGPITENMRGDESRPLEE